MKIVRYSNPSLSPNELTHTTNKCIMGALILRVQNTADFAVGDYIVIEQVGNEHCELNQITAIPTVFNGTGTIKSLGTVVTGTSTKFLSEVQIGDVLTANSITAKVLRVDSDTQIILEAQFSTNLTSAFSFTVTVNKNTAMTISAVIPTQNTGTGTISSTGTAVTGSSTNFTGQLAVNKLISVGLQTRRVTNIGDNTHLTIDSAFLPDVSGSTFIYRPSPNTTSTTSGTIFSHTVSTLITKTFFDEANIYRSSDNVSYSLVNVQILDFQDKYNLITYNDLSGDDTYYYKIGYFNSTSNEEQFTPVIHTASPTGYISVQEFKDETGIKADDLVIAHALKYGCDQIRRVLFSLRTYKTQTPATSFTPPMDGLEFADFQTDGLIDRNDVNIWEEDTNGVRTYINSDISGIDVDRHIINFTNPHPATGKTVNFEYYLTYRKLSYLVELQRRISMLYAIQYLYRNTMNKRLQRGIDSWSINGVSVNFNLASVKDLMDSNQKEITNLLNDISRLYIQRSAIYPRKTISFIKSATGTLITTG